MPEIRIGSTISRAKMPVIDTVLSTDIRIPEIKVRESTEVLSNRTCSKLLSELKASAEAGLICLILADNRVPLIDSVDNLYIEFISNKKKN